MAQPRGVEVLIVGAGTTGLLIAQGLKKNNIKFTVFEYEMQDAYSKQQRDWTMALLWGADYVKNTLPDELRERFNEIKADPFDPAEGERGGTLPFYNGKTGELATNIPGGVAVRVSRRKLRKLFSADLDIQFGKKVVNATEQGDKIVLHFDDSSIAIGDTVVFCDGVRKSIGRSLLFEPEKAELKPADCTIVNICNTYTADQAEFIRGTLDPVFKFAAHPDQPTLYLLTSVDIPNLEHPEDWQIQILFTTWGAEPVDDAQERLRIFKEKAADYAEPWRSAALWLPEDTIIPRERIKYWATPTPWQHWNGKLTLAGDAAHPMVPFRAQGLNNAMADSYGYVEALRMVVSGQMDLEQAIGEYGKECFARGAKEIAMSNAFGPLMHNWEALQNSPLMRGGYGKKIEQQEAKPAVVAVPVANGHTEPLTNGHTVPLTNGHTVPLTNGHTVPLTNGHTGPLTNGEAVQVANGSAEKVYEPPAEFVEKTPAVGPIPPVIVEVILTPSEDDKKAAAVQTNSVPVDRPNETPGTSETAKTPAVQAESMPVDGPIEILEDKPVAENHHPAKVAIKKVANVVTTPDYEALKAENKRLKQLNSELLQALKSVSEILGNLPHLPLASTV